MTLKLAVSRSRPPVPYGANLLMSHCLRKLVVWNMQTAKEVVVTKWREIHQYLSPSCACVTVFAEADWSARMLCHVVLTSLTLTVLYRMTCLEYSLRTSTVSDELHALAVLAPHTRCLRNVRLVCCDSFLLHFLLHERYCYNMLLLQMPPLTLVDCVCVAQW